jgi:4-hydroxybutyrate CoA-transferase
VSARTGMSGEWLSAAAAVARIPRGARVFLQQGAAEPILLHQALVDAAATTEINLLAAPVTGLNACAFAGTPHVRRLRPVVFVATPDLSEALRTGAAEYVPLHWSQVVAALRGRFRPDVALIQVSPPDSEGYCCIGGSAAFELEVAMLARIVIAEVNPRVPVVQGDTCLHQSAISFCVASDVPLRSMPPATWGDVDARIAKYVAELVPEDCTMQIGPGKVPDAVMDCLHKAHKRVHFHSGILTSSMLGVAREDRPFVAGMLLGDEQFYRDVHRHPRVSLRSTEYTHSLEVMGSIERFISVNSAIEVDLLGQVNAENVGGRQVSGVGGQVDFFRGARASRGGLAIVAMPSCTSSRSRIVFGFEPGRPVSTSRVDLDYVVTEYGAAALRDRTERERAEALIAVAAPEHRESLRADWARSR